MSYVPLGILSAHSLDDSVITVDELIECAFEHRCPAVGLPERTHMYSLVNFYQKALKKGIKPLLGATLTLECPGGSLECILYCLNQQGFENLSKFISAYYKQKKTQKGLSLALLEQHPELLVLIRQGDFIAKEVYQDAIMTALKEKFGADNVFMALERYENDLKSLTLSYQALELAKAYNIPAVAVHQTFFLQKKDYEAQQIKYCIQQGQYFDDQQRTIKHYEYQYFYSYDQMRSLYQDCLQALDNTQLIAQKCTVTLDFSSVHLPKFSPDENLTLREMSENGLQDRFARGHLYFSDLQRYQKRLAIELEVIEKMGFAGYFLIVADFIQWAKVQEIPVGPGRGSGAGSLVAYVLKITDLDPLQYQLLFERFLNPERVSMPDFDIDFCMEKRDLVIEYVQKRYGVSNVSQIATFGTMAAKAVIRDVGRVLHHPYGFVDKIAKLVPLDIGITLKEALEQSSALKQLYRTDEVVKQLLDLALNLEGLPRNVGKHAGGVIIAPKPLENFCPLYNEPGAPWQPVSHLDKDDIEKIGLVKFDFLGLKTLTVINWTYQNNDFLKEETLSLDKLPLDCPKSFELLQNAQTTAVFQLESRGMKQLISKLQPDCFEDMIALVALFRPGPLQSGMVDDFIDRKHGRSAITYLHPSLEPILQPTYGVILYQEQVMQIAQVLAEYTLGQADLLRRAMGKKKPEEMAKQRKIFLQGCQDRGVETQCASDIFDLMEKFAGYGFNKSHSAAYALIAYQTLYLKTHCKSAFFAANMSADASVLEKVKNLIIDAQEHGIEVVAPDINRSFKQFRPLDNKTIIYGFIAIKGLGENVIDFIVNQREKDGPFLNFNDFMKRTAPLKIQRRTLELLAKSGVFDSFFSHRRMFVDHLIEKKIFEFYQRDLGQEMLFGFEEEKEEEYPVMDDYLWSEKLKNEMTLLGYSFSGELLDPFRCIKNKPYELLETRHSIVDKKEFLVMASPMRELTTGSGKKIVIFSFFDGKESLDILLGREKNEELIEHYCALQSLGLPLVAQVKKSVSSQSKKEYLNLEKLWTFDEYLGQAVQSSRLTLCSDQKKDRPLERFFQEFSQTDLPFELTITLKDPKTAMTVDYLKSNASVGTHQNSQKKQESFYAFLEKSYQLGLALEFIEACDQQ